MFEKAPATDRPRDVRAKLPSRVAAAFGRATPTLKLLGWLVGGTLLVWTGRIAYLATEDGTFKRELVIVALGAVMTALSAVAVAVLALFNEVRQMRDRHSLTRFNQRSWGTQNIRVGRMEIPSISLVQVSNGGVEWTAFASLEFADFAASRELSPENQETSRRDSKIREMRS